MNKMELFKATYNALETWRIIYKADSDKNLSDTAFNLYRELYNTVIESGFYKEYEQYSFELSI